MTTVEAIVGGVGRLVAQNVSRCKENMERQRFLCLQDKEKIVQMLVREPFCFHTIPFLSSGSG